MERHGFEVKKKVEMDVDVDVRVKGGEDEVEDAKEFPNFIDGSE